MLKLVQEKLLIMIVRTQDIVRVNCSIVEYDPDRPRVRLAQYFVMNNILNENKITTLSFDEARKQGKFIIYEIGTTEGPHWWLGYKNSDHPTMPNLFDVLNKQQFEILKYIINGNGVIHIDQCLESFPLWVNDSTFEEKEICYYKNIHDKCKIHNIPLSKIFYSTSNLMENELYDRWCKENNIQEKMNMICDLFFARLAKDGFFYSGYNDNNFTFPENDISVLTFEEHINYKQHNDIKTFSCLNRVIRPHRVAFLAMLNHYNMINGSELSFDKLNLDETNLNRDIFFNHSAFDDQNIKAIEQLTPLYLDVTEFETNQAQSFFKETYLNTWYSAITETYFYEYYNTSMFFSEKIFKPVCAMHPFVLVGQQFSLKYFKKLGFKTFDSVWDESYDTIRDPVQRMDAICKLMQNLNRKSKHEWIEMYYKIQPILIHNFNHLKDTPWGSYAKF